MAEERLLRSGLVVMAEDRVLAGPAPPLAYCGKNDVVVRVDLQIRSVGDDADRILPHPQSIVTSPCVRLGSAQEIPRYPRLKTRPRRGKITPLSSHSLKFPGESTHLTLCLPGEHRVHHRTKVFKDHRPRLGKIERRAQENEQKKYHFKQGRTLQDPWEKEPWEESVVQPTTPLVSFL